MTRGNSQLDIPGAYANLEEILEEQNGIDLLNQNSTSSRERGLTNDPEANVLEAAIVPLRDNISRSNKIQASERSSKSDIRPSIFASNPTQRISAESPTATSKARLCKRQCSNAESDKRTLSGEENSKTNLVKANESKSKSAKSEAPSLGDRNEMIRCNDPPELQAMSRDTTETSSDCDKVKVQSRTRLDKSESQIVPSDKVTINLIRRDDSWQSLVSLNRICQVQHISKQGKLTTIEELIILYEVLMPNSHSKPI